MIDERDLLERALRRFEPEPGLTDRVMDRRDRKRRNQRIRAGALGVAVTLAVAIGVGRTLLIEPEPFESPTPTPSAERVGFLGLPPEGAKATPVRGELLYYLETSARDGDQFDVTVSVYTGGQVIWERDGGTTGVPEGAKEKNTGYLVQELSPVGVEMLTDEILGTGLFEHDLAFRGDYVGPFESGAGTFHGPSGLWMDYFGDRGKVTVSWYAGQQRFDGPPTPAEREALGSLVDRLADPAAWLPDEAWKDRQIRAFVSSTYTVYICCGSRDTVALPAPADQLLVDYEEWYCITTEQARDIAEGFDAAGVPLTGPWYPGGITYDLEHWADYRSDDHAISIYPHLDPQC